MMKHLILSLLYIFIQDFISSTLLSLLSHLHELPEKEPVRHGSPHIVISSPWFLNKLVNNRSVWWFYFSSKSLFSSFQELVELRVGSVVGRVVTEGGVAGEGFVITSCIKGTKCYDTRMYV